MILTDPGLFFLGPPVDETEPAEDDILLRGRQPTYKDSNK